MCIAPSPSLPKAVQFNVTHAGVVVVVLVAVAVVVNVMAMGSVRGLAAAVEHAGTRS